MISTRPVPGAVFVMGATGRVGGALVRALKGQRRAVAASHAHTEPQSDTRWVRFSLEDRTTYAEALRDVSAIFLMRPPQVTEAKVFVPFLTEAKARDIRRMVVLSVMGAEANPLLRHHRLEKLVMQMGFDWTMIRPSDFMQNLETVHLTGIRERNQISVPAGDGKSSFIDVEDIGEVIASVLLQPGHQRKGYTLTGPTALSCGEVATVMTELLDRSITYRKVGALLFFFEQIAGGQPLPLSLVMTALYTVQRIGSAAKVTDEVRRLIGRPPRTLREYIERNRNIWTR